MWRWGIPVAIAVGVAHIAARQAGRHGVARLLKVVPILFLAAMVGAEPAPVGERYRWLVFAALVWSASGDLSLVFPGGFGLGLLNFLIAHVLYITAFAPSGGWDGQAWMLLVPFALFAAAMLAYLWPHLASQRVPVAVYVTVIAVMGWRAAVRAGVTPVPSGGFALAGALFFMLSDAWLAVDRFARRFAAADAVVMTTYYAAQILIALSVRA